MTLTLKRTWKKQNYTIGELFADGKYLCNTLEDTDRGLNNNMSENTIHSKKIYGNTAIPTGTYKIQMSYSSKFASRKWAARYGGKVPELLNVKGFAGIRIHPGNTADDTLGCILPGKNTTVGRVNQSTQCYYEILDNYIIPAIIRGENVSITIN